jgi:membrane-associated phospholipid phosphatase
MTPLPAFRLPRQAALKVLGWYLAFATMLAVWSGFRGDGGFIAVAVYGMIGLVIVSCAASGSRSASSLSDWLPLLALPLLYGAIPRTAIPVGPFDGAIQGLDRLIFRTEPARTFAGAAPWRLVSEVLHASYLSYNLIIYLPPLLMYLRGNAVAFRQTVLAVTVAMVVCFAAFCVFPVEGPRYLWPPPSGIADGTFRRLVVVILNVGSSQGTAFPSSHEAISMAMSLSTSAWDRRLGVLLLVVSALLGLGAVYGGFHYATDMIFGAIVGLASWRFVRPSPRSTAASA